MAYQMEVTSGRDILVDGLNVVRSLSHVFTSWNRVLQPSRSIHPLKKAHTGPMHHECRGELGHLREGVWEGHLTVVIKNIESLL